MIGRVPVGVVAGGGGAGVLWGSAPRRYRSGAGRVVLLVGVVGLEGEVGRTNVSLSSGPLQEVLVEMLARGYQAERRLEVAADQFAADPVGEMGISVTLCPTERSSGRAGTSVWGCGRR
jgi:hypothetical protein